MKTKGAIKFVVWTAVAIALCVYAVYAHETGKIDQMYYHSTKLDGFAVNTNGFFEATKEKPALLQIGKADEIKGLMAVPVKKGDRLPKGANGVIDKKIAGRRQAGQGGRGQARGDGALADQGDQGLQVQGHLHPQGRRRPTRGRACGTSP